MDKIELLAPAGDKEKMKTAFKFGADAVYFAGKKFGLRAFSDNFEDEEIIEYTSFAHSLGKKAYITLNILAHNVDFESLENYLLVLNKAKVDAVIVSDIGIMSFVKKICPNIDIHVSTQANITNKYSAMEFVKMGAKRLILARELSLKEIKEIRDFVPQSVEIETFVHGAMCISYSGRCLLSNYLANRDSNRGACVQACRWNYALSEKSRTGEYYPVQEDERGTYILNSKDLMLIQYIDKLYEAGIRSFKIEGRMKSPYYTATVVNSYRRAIDEFYKNPTKFVCPSELIDELYKTSNRGFTTGFYFNEKIKENTISSSPVQSCEFIANVVEDAKDGYVTVEQRNKFCVGDVLEVLSPTQNFNKTIKITEILDDKGEKVIEAKNVQQILKIKTDLKLCNNDMLRKHK